MAPTLDKVSTFKIYITNLPANMKNEDVGKLFEPYGRVVESEVFRGNYAFVHMEDDVNGRKAIEEMNGKEIDEHVISVCQSKNIQGPKIPTMKLAVKNIPNSLSAVELRNLFTKYGFVLEAEVKGQNGHVLLEATGDIRSAINEVSNHTVDGQTLKVEAQANYTPTNASSAPPQKSNRSKLLGKRKEPAPAGPPHGRHAGPPGFVKGPLPGPAGFHGYPPHRRPGPPLPGPPRLRPGPPPPMARPYYAGRPPHDYDQDGYDDGPPEYYGHADDFSDDYDDPSYYAQPPVPPPPARRPLPPPPRQYYEDEPYEAYHYDGPRPPGPPPPAGLYSRPKRIARDRPFPAPSGPPKPLLANDPMYPPPPFRGREPQQQQEDFYNDYEPPIGPPARPHPPPNNNYRPPPLVPPPVPAPNPNIRKAKVTKFGKIVIEGSKGKAPGEKKHRGVRGGAKARARKAALANNASKKLPSLLDPIPGTVRVVADARNPMAHPRPPPLIMQQGRGKPSAAAAGPRPLLPPRSSGLPAPLMGPPLRNPPRQPGNMGPPKSSLLALYHETKRPVPPEQHHPQYAAPLIKQDIDFTADIELP